MTYFKKQGSNQQNLLIFAIWTTIIANFCLKQGYWLNIADFHLIFELNLLRILKFDIQVYPLSAVLCFH